MNPGYSWADLAAANEQTVLNEGELSGTALQGQFQTTTAATGSTTNPLTNCFEHECGAIAVAAVTVLGNYAFIRYGGTLLVAAAPVAPGLVLGIGQGDLSEGRYFADNNPSLWTPQGAASAWANGFWQGFTQ
jgi:hypothetical protein